MYGGMGMSVPSLHRESTDSDSLCFMWDVTLYSNRVPLLLVHIYGTVSPTQGFHTINRLFYGILPPSPDARLYASRSMYVVAPLSICKGSRNSAAIGFYCTLCGVSSPL